MNDITEGRKPALPYGAYSQIARRLRPPVSVVTVRAVYLGKVTSARVSRAIENYVRRLEKKNSQEQSAA